MRSIRRQLLVWLLAMLVVATAVAAVLFYFKIRDEANEIFDYHLAQTAFSLRDQVLENEVPAPSGELHYDLIIQIWSPTGERIYLSEPHSTLPNRGRLGFQTVSTTEGAWRVFSVQIRDRTIQVAQPQSVRRQLAQNIAMHSMLPFAVLLPLIGAMLWIIVGRGLRPLDSLADQLAHRSADALTPLTETGLPQETLSLVRALNALLERLERSIGTQRTFVGDAAHELRSPLTAIQLQTQIAERAHTEAERVAAFASLKGGIRRATHLVQQLLTLARQEADVAAQPFEAVDLNQIALDVIAEKMAFAMQKRIDLTCRQTDRVTLTGDLEALRAMISNLIDNAIRYIPHGGKVEVALSRDAEGSSISVVDNGPGIPVEERERVFDRFYRCAGNESAGSGLGLAIIKNVADKHRAQLSLSEGDSGIGLRVSVRFPATSVMPGVAASA